MKPHVGKLYFSEIRWQYFLKTIHLLKEHGDVYLVRLPVDKKVRKIENKYLPDFDSLIANLNSMYHSPYFDMGQETHDFSFNDGQHLSIESASEASRLIADWIFENKNKVIENTP